MPARNPDERALAARIAAAERWGRTVDRTAATAPARTGLRARFAAEADPNGVLSEREREARVDQLMQAHMLRMTLAAKAARRKAREAASAADAAEETLRQAGGTA